MKLRALLTALGLVTAAGCATQGGERAAWAIEPVVAVRHGMQDGHAAYQLGRHHHARGRLDEAETAYLRAAASVERRPEALSALGALYAERGEWERSVKTFERAVSLAPLTSRLHGNHGYALMLTGEFDDAADALQRAVRLDRGNRRAWRHLAEAYRRLGASAEAERADAAARGSLPDETGTPAAQPMPVAPVTAGGSDRGGGLNTSPRRAGTAAVRRSAVTPAQSGSIHVMLKRAGARLVKVGKNVLELRIPSANADNAGEQAAP